ncbi:unnamed protein product [Discula destructiva]
MTVADGRTSASSLWTSLDWLNECDGFPYADREPEQFARKMGEMYTLVWEDEAGVFPIGYMLKGVLDELKKVPFINQDIVLDPYARTVKIFHKHTTEWKRTQMAAATTQYLRINQTFSMLKSWRNEMWPVYGRNGEVLFSMERAAIGLFGFMRYGIHLIAYTRCPTAPHGIKLWVPKRSQFKNAWPGLFDNTVAGGLMTDESPFECVVRESDEEASLPERLVREHAKLRPGTVRYIYMTKSRPGIDDGYIYPECQWVYDLELPEDVIPEPNDGEVESFSLCTVDEVRKQLARGSWKPNCAVIILDFFIRMGILNPENEPYFDEIETRLRRRMPFPGPHTLYGDD